MHWILYLRSAIALQKSNIQKHVEALYIHFVSWRRGHLMVCEKKLENDVMGALWLGWKMDLFENPRINKLMVRKFFFNEKKGKISNFHNVVIWRKRSDFHTVKFTYFNSLIFSKTDSAVNHHQNPESEHFRHPRKIPHAHLQSISICTLSPM